MTDDAPATTRAAAEKLRHGAQMLVSLADAYNDVDPLDVSPAEWAALARATELVDEAIDVLDHRREPSS